MNQLSIGMILLALILLLSLHHCKAAVSELQGRDVTYIFPVNLNCTKKENALLRAGTKIAWSIGGSDSIKELWSNSINEHDVDDEFQFRLNQCNYEVPVIEIIDYDLDMLNFTIDESLEAMKIFEDPEKNKISCSITTSSYKDEEDETTESDIETINDNESTTNGNGKQKVKTKKVKKNENNNRRILNRFDSECCYCRSEDAGDSGCPWAACAGPNDCCTLQERNPHNRCYHRRQLRSASEQRELATASDMLREIAIPIYEMLDVMCVDPQDLKVVIA